MDIDRGGVHDYDLGLELNALVIQEFTDDFVDYLKEMEHDGYEVTLDKSSKKKLVEALDRCLGPSDSYFELWEDGLSSDDEGVESLVLGTQSTRNHPGKPTAPLIAGQSPLLLPMTLTWPLALREQSSVNVVFYLWTLSVTL